MRMHQMLATDSNNSLSNAQLCLPIAAPLTESQLFCVIFFTAQSYLTLTYWQLCRAEEVQWTVGTCTQPLAIYPAIRSLQNDCHSGTTNVPFMPSFWKIHRWITSSISISAWDRIGLPIIRASHLRIHGLWLLSDKE